LSAKKFQSDPALGSDDYTRLFAAFTANTDGKKIIAKAILAIAQQIKASSLLDLGAGDGLLTSKLAPGFTSITLVERKEEFCAKLRDIPGVSVHHGAMEDFTPVAPHDLVLLSYSLSGVSSERIEEFLQRLPGFASENGKVLIVTYEKGCEWDQFADEVYAMLDIPRSPGTASYIKIAQAQKLALETIHTCPSHMWSNTVEGLAALTSFFFASKAAEYQKRFPEVVEILKRYAAPLEGGRIGLRAVEKVYELQDLRGS